MNHAEAGALCGIVRAYCPQQTFDAYTPAAWHDLLSDLRFEDARAAAAEVARSQPFVAPAEIRAVVRRTREARLLAAPPVTPPEGVADDTAAYLRWLRDVRRRIADGETITETRPLTARPVRELLARGFHQAGW